MTTIRARLSFNRKAANPTRIVVVPMIGITPNSKATVILKDSSFGASLIEKLEESFLNFLNTFVAILYIPGSNHILC